MEIIKDLPFPTISFIVGAIALRPGKSLPKALLFPARVCSNVISKPASESWYVELALAAPSEALWEFEKGNENGIPSN